MIASGAHVSGPQGAGLAAEHSSVPYVAPFVLFLVLIASRSFLGVLGRWEVPFTVLVMTACFAVVSRHVIDLRTRYLLGSLAVGIAVFFLWIGPDVVWPNYRTHWLFQNSITGKLATTIPEDLLDDRMVLIFRTIRAVLIVPIAEELFWRAWLLRWMAAKEFWRLPIGSYTPMSFGLTAVLFASEHGPYWDVGLLTGLIYNWWMVRTRSLGDCILMHAVTNACLSGYVIYAKQWQYWL